ncbi:MAG: hypothetical protein ACRCYQ_02725 [Nocardioides sp.]
MLKDIETAKTLRDRMLVRYVAFAAPRPRDERGDVPGWVLITVMTAALVVFLLAIAKERLGEMLRTALDSVGG